MKLFPAIRLLLIFSLPWIATPTLATSCAQVAFLDTVEFGNISHVVAFRVLDYGGVETTYPTWMDVEVTREFRGELTKERIRITGNDNGLSARPYVTEFDQDSEWVQALEEIDDKFYLAGCSAQLQINNEEVTGYIRPCSDNPEQANACANLGFDDLDTFQDQNMTVSEFELAMSLYSDGFAKALRVCASPLSRCRPLRGRYDPQTGLLEVPALDILPRPGDFPLTYGASAVLQQEKGSPTLFRLIEFKR